MVKGGGVHAIGRRKSAVARVYLRTGTGKVSVNGKETLQYFGRPNLDLHLREPLTLAGVTEKYDVFVNVAGGGKTGQAGAVRMAIGRALLTAEEGVRKIIKPAGILTRDAREVERKKFGRHKARKRPQFSKR